MKKITLPVLALAALIVASCAKEKDGYDKNLTKDTWNLSTLKTVDETVVEKVYTDGTDNTTTTTRTTTTVAAGEKETEQYQLQTEVGSADQFMRQIQKSELTVSYKFEEDGNFTSNQTEKVKSYSQESTGNPLTTVTVTTAATTSSNSGLWSWQNTADQKALLSFDLGSLQVVKISKDELTLKLSTKSTEVSKPSSALTQTETATQTVDVSFSK